MTYQTHLIVYGPGGYRFTDFMRVGLPLDVALRRHRGLPDPDGLALLSVSAPQSPRPLPIRRAYSASQSFPEGTGELQNFGKGMPSPVRGRVALLDWGPDPPSARASDRRQHPRAWARQILDFGGTTVLGSDVARR